MADARLRSEWLGQMRFDDLSDAAWRVFTSALMWSVGNGTDGVIPKRYLRYLHPSGTVEPAVIADLVKASAWSEQGDAYVMVDWAGALGQSTAEQIDKYREDARERQRRRRERAKQRRDAQEGEQSPPEAQSEGVTPNVTRDVTQNVGIGTGNGKGKGKGSGKRDLSENVNERTGEVTSWATAEIPVDDPTAWGSADAPGSILERGAA